MALYHLNVGVNDGGDDNGGDDNGVDQEVDYSFRCVSLGLIRLNYGFNGVGGDGGDHEVDSYSFKKLIGLFVH